ncbi:hypothetical protein [Microcoleus phage My-WqHQDG]|nr:hypothetical protein [Microcoleus phage My-WqHQDG]
MPLLTEQLLENVLTSYGVAPHPYIGTRAISPQGDTRFTSINSGPGYLITLTRPAPIIKPCCDISCSIPTDTVTIPLREGQSLTTATDSWYPRMGVGARLYTHIPPFTFKYENTIDVPPYWAGALLAKGCSRDDAITIPIPSRDHYEVMENYNTQFYYLNRIPLEALPHKSCDEPLPKAATMPGVYGFISYLTYDGRPELSLDLQAVGILGTTWNRAYIPSNYQHAVYWERLAFLRGVMDYRGTVTDKGVAQLLVTSKQMLEDLHYLVRRLGGWTKATTCGCCEDPCGWLVDILLPGGESPFHVTPQSYIGPSSIVIPPWIVTGIKAVAGPIVGGMVSPGGVYFIYPDVLVGEV